MLAHASPHVERIVYSEGSVTKAKIAFGVAFALSATSAFAAPPIAYSKAGTGGAPEVWLVNPDGTEQDGSGQSHGKSRRR